MSTMGCSARILALVLLAFHGCTCAFEVALGHGDDLSSFVTRPEIKAPVLDVRVHEHGGDPQQYIFTAPYVSLYQQSMPRSYYQPCQTGPHIYDSSGELIWSGACHFQNKNMADFRPVAIGDHTYALSAIDIGLSEAEVDSYGKGSARGRGILLDNSYELQASVHPSKDVEAMNMHDFKITAEKTALHLQWKPEYADVSELGLWRRSGWVGNMGFREVDLATNQTVFEWWALGKIPLTESSWPLSEAIRGPAPACWDYLHFDSVDKAADGDYLVSARHTNTIYKISKLDHSIKWRLGGNSSSFDLGRLDIRRQHDARFVQPEDLNLPKRDGMEYISLFNNAADETESWADASTAVILELDLTSKNVHVLRSTRHPENEAALFSGNTHVLPSGHLFTSWGVNGPFMEYATDGRVFSEWKFKSGRFSNYRTYLAHWKAYPSQDELFLACSAFGTSPEKATTACWVSWNGATEVRAWRFHFEIGGAEISQREVPKAGFETMAQRAGYSKVVFVEALAEDGTILGRSSNENVSLTDNRYSF